VYASQSLKRPSDLGLAAEAVSMKRNIPVKAKRLTKNVRVDVGMGLLKSLNYFAYRIGHTQKIGR
jgi:hypothetical protein